MIQMEISPEEYAKYHNPAAHYMFAVRRLENYEKIGSVAIPDKIRQETRKFIGYAQVLSVSPFNSHDEETEYIKGIVRGCKYVGFGFHSVAQVVLMPQFKLPASDDLIELHVKDITIYGDNMDELIARQREFEVQEEARLSASAERAHKEYEESRQMALEWQKEKYET